MATIKVNRQHRLNPERARATVEKLAKRLQKELDAEYHWNGSRLVFTRTGASGYIDVGDDEVQVEVKLGVLLRPLKGRIQKTIEEEIDRYLVA